MKYSINGRKTIVNYFVHYIFYLPISQVYFDYLPEQCIKRIMPRANSILLVSMCFLIMNTMPFGEAKKKAKVLILGAGLSGITAAKTLLENNITDFYVLEGQDYIGGRIHAFEFEGVTIETGANWLHFLDDEDTTPLLKRMEEAEMGGVPSNYSDFIIRFVVTVWSQ